MITFCQETKDDLCENPVKAACCKSAMLYGMLMFSSVISPYLIELTCENESVVSTYERLLIEVMEVSCDIEYHSQCYRLSIRSKEALDLIYEKYGDLSVFRSEYIKCQNCLSYYFRGAFLCAGTVNSPTTPKYHLEIETTKILSDLTCVLNDLGLQFKSIKRKNKVSIYLKKGEDIQDFLNYIGAKNSAFCLINEKIRREIRNNVNRQNNFDSANIKRSIASKNKYIKAINNLKKTNNYSLLTDDMKKTCEIIINNPDASLNEIAMLHDPAISKSGLYNRLKKILDLDN